MSIKRPSRCCYCILTDVVWTKEMLRPRTLGCLNDCIGVSNRTLNNGLVLSRAASKSHPLHLRSTSLSVQTRHWEYIAYELGLTIGESYTMRRWKAVKTPFKLRRFLCVLRTKWHSWTTVHLLPVLRSERQKGIPLFHWQDGYLLLRLHSCTTSDLDTLIPLFAYSL